jgi:hypothetical protein
LLLVLHTLALNHANHSATRCFISSIATVEW